jgi:hypothetical protein
MRIDDNYKINTDGAGTILIFEEKRQREKAARWWTSSSQTSGST